MIEVEELTKNFGVTTALNRISFRVKKGEILGFLGPNGAGKTTAMRILTGFLTPTSGTARIAGFDIQRQSLQARRKIGYLPESAPIYRDMYVRDYLRFISTIKGMTGPEGKRRIGSVIEDCGLDQVRNRIIGKLSKGYRQRVGLAQALIGDPDILIMDEPTEGLDPKQIIEIRNLIKNLGGNRTVILSTHILPEVSMICERVIILNEGKLIAVDTPENLNRSLTKHSQIMLGVRGPAEQITAVLQSVPGVLKVECRDDFLDSMLSFNVEVSQTEDIRSRLAEKIISNRWELLELRSTSLSLEDIFIKLVTREEEEPSV
ncbi:ATP-binding cassette domain-containing protein [bacterium]|nr:ATP-binding cassette domain-containing protein [candidate division CSSED10-310 bacterium]